MANDGGTAFPSQAGYDFKGERVTTTNEGMTLRDYFAIQALAALIGATSTPATLGPSHKEANLGFAKGAYALADAMLEARKE